jgi:hypothetical protein
MIIEIAPDKRMVFTGQPLRLTTGSSASLSPVDSPKGSYKLSQTTLQEVAVAESRGLVKTSG